MNIYFSCSITGGREEKAIYQVIVKELEEQGHEVPTAHLSSPDVMELEKVVDPVEIYERGMAWIRDCDAVIAEVSTPSHGVGYEIAYALSLRKPVLCCYKKDKKVSKIITGNISPGLTVIVYEHDEEAVTAVRKFTKLLQKEW